MPNLNDSQSAMYGNDAYGETHAHHITRNRKYEQTTIRMQYISIINNTNGQPYDHGLHAMYGEHVSCEYVEQIHVNMEQKHMYVTNHAAHLHSLTNRASCISLMVEKYLVRMIDSHASM